LDNEKGFHLPHVAYEVINYEKPLGFRVLLRFEIWMIATKRWFVFSNLEKDLDLVTKTCNK
jgi:hypothetical protein